MGTFLAWFTAIGLQTFRDVRVEHRAPIPSEFVASGALFGALTLLSGFDDGLAAVLAWGFLVAIALEAGGPVALAGGISPNAAASSRAIAKGETMRRAAAKGKGGGGGGNQRVK